MVVDVRFGNLGISLGLYSRISPSFSRGIFSHLLRLDQSCTSKNSWWIMNSDMFPLLQFTLLYSAIQQYVPLSSLDGHNRIHSSESSSLTCHVLSLFPKFIKYSMKTSTAFKENTVFSIAVMTRLTWRYRDRELITASSFKLLKAGNMSWILGLDSKSLKQNHSWSSLSILNNWNSIHVYFR